MLWKWTATNSKQSKHKLKQICDNSKVWRSSLVLSTWGIVYFFYFNSPTIKMLDLIWWCSVLFSYQTIPVKVQAVRQSFRTHAYIGYFNTTTTQEEETLEESSSYQIMDVWCGLFREHTMAGETGTIPCCNKCLYKCVWDQVHRTVYCVSVLAQT